MPYCAKCGADNDAAAQFCKNCGTQINAAPGYPPPPPQGFPPPPPPGYPPQYQQPGYGQQSQSGLQENIAGLLAYVVGWLTGLVFFFIDKRPFVRFHAMQSILLFGGIHVIHILISILLFSSFRMWAFAAAVSSLIGLVSLVLWILLMVKAYQGQWFKLPIIGDLAEKYSRQ